MSIAIDWPTGVISVPQADLTSLGGGVYELDLETFRLALRALEATDDGMFFPPTHVHNPPVDIGGTTLAQVVLLINGYTVTFEDDQYAVNIVGGNSNVAPNVNVNQVSVRPGNSAGLITVVQGSGVTEQDKIDIAALVLAGIPALVPSAPQNAAAVGDLELENGETLADQVRLVRAFAAGDGDVPAGPGPYAFKNAAGDDTRIEGTYDGTTRTVTKADGA